MLSKNNKTVLKHIFLMAQPVSCCESCYRAAYSYQAAAPDGRKQSSRACADEMLTWQKHKNKNADGMKF